MNKSEKERSKNLRKLVEQYENSAGDKHREQIRAEINSLTDHEIEVHELEYYYASESIEEFCDKHAIEVEPIQDRTEAEIQLFLEKIISNYASIDSSYYFEKYSPAIEFFYKKSTGAVYDLFYEGKLSYEDCVKELKSDKNAIIKL